MDTTVEVMMDTAVAKDFRMLSAYLITTATTRPPPASKAMTAHTRGLNPWKKPDSAMASPSCNSAVHRAMTKANMESCTFLAHTEGGLRVDPAGAFRTDSKY